MFLDVIFIVCSELANFHHDHTIRTTQKMAEEVCEGVGRGVFNQKQILSHYIAVHQSRFGRFLLHCIATQDWQILFRAL